MPRPDAGCIWTSFQSSGKRHLLLTGGRGSGKTTLLNALAARLAEGPLPGVTTWAEPGREVRLRENGSGAWAAVGVFDPSLPGPENRMRPVEEAFRTLGVPALARAGAAAGKWASVDEVGYLETTCPDYCAALLALMERKRLLAAVRKQDLPFLRALCQRPDVFCVDLDAPYGRLGCVIMASGLGRRFGGGKLLARLHGKPCSSMRWTPPAACLPAGWWSHGTRPPRLCAGGRGSRRSCTASPAAATPSGWGSKLWPGMARRRWTGACSVPPTSLCSGGRRWPAWPSAPPARRGPSGGPHGRASRARRSFFRRGPLRSWPACPRGRGGGAVVRRWPERVRCVPAASPDELRDVDRREDLVLLESKYYT